MAKPVKTRISGKNLLLSVALGTTPLVGCTPAPTRPIDTGATPVTQAASGEERALFDRASQSGNVALINRFLRTYPDSPLVRRLLVNLPPETLQQIDRTVVAALGTALIRSLPTDTRNALGIAPIETEGDMTSVASDGYAG